MSALCIPKTVIKAIDKRRRAFFWTGEDTCHGSKCLVEWTAVQAPKHKGGLGVKDLENRCLLMKFINKLYSDENPSWKNWILTTASSETFTSQTPSYLWNIINDELNSFRSITYVKVKNGVAASFWFDHWFHSGPLSSTYPALFSDTTRPDVSVQYVFQHGFEMHLRPRLTSTASQQLELLLDILQDFDLEESHDIRLLKSADRPYTTRAVYALLDNLGDVNDRHGSLIWKTHVPNKVKIFAWLYFKDRLSRRVNLFSKHIADDQTCERCSGEDEDRHHVFFGCTESKRLWDTIGLNSISWERDEDIWTPSLPAMFDLRVWSFVLLTVLWRIWDAMNGHIFRNEQFSIHVVLARVWDDLVTWKKRLPLTSVPSLTRWHAHICAFVHDLGLRHG
jgi:hypothetical protein